MRRALLLLLVIGSFEAAAAVTGRVMDEDGKPLEGARVRAFARETTLGGYDRLVSDKPERVPIASVETKSDGAFSIDIKQHGAAELVLDAPGRQVVWTEAADGEDAGAFVLARAAMKHGRVTSGGRGVANALVAVGRVHHARTNDEGWYETPDPAGWAERVQVFHPDYALAESWQSPLPLDVVLQSGRTIAGRVVAADGTTPVVGATIRAGSFALATSAADGTFRIAHAPTFATTISARHGASVGVTTLDKRATSHTIRLRPASRLSGSVRTPKDVPVAGARVVARGDVVYSAITDAKGNFSFEPLTAGSYTVSVQHPAFGADQSPLTLAESAHVTRTITAAPLSRLRGTVIDEEKRPVAAARVATSFDAGNVTTAPDGSFLLRFSPFLERAVTIAVVKKGYAAMVHGPVTLESGETKQATIVLPRGFAAELRLVDGAGEPIANEPLLVTRATEDMRPLPILMPCAEPDPSACRTTNGKGVLTLRLTSGKYDVSAGGKTTPQKQLARQELTASRPAITIELERGAAIEGTVVWADGRPVDVPVRVAPTTSRPAPGVLVENGAFALRNLPAGKVTIHAETATGQLQSEPIEVTAPATGIVLRMPQPARVEGRVVDRESKQPVRNFEVSIERAQRMRPPLTQSFQNDDGRFVLDDVQTGNVNLRVAAQGFVTAIKSSVALEEGKTASVDVALERGGTLVGRVTADGRPLADARVAVDPSRTSAMRNMPVASTRTDGSGEFTLHGLPAGAQAIYVNKQGFVAKTVDVEMATARETRLDVELERGRELRGRVVDASGALVANASINARATGRERGAFGVPNASSDAEGMFRVEGLGEGTYAVMVRKEGFVPGSVEANPASGTLVTITLERGGTISGRVTGVAEGDMGRVEIMTNGGSSTRVSDAAGNFSLSGVNDGRVEVRAVIAGTPRRQSAPKAVDVVNGSAPFVQLDFSEGFVVRGRVTRNGRPVHGGISFTEVSAPGRRAGWGDIGNDGTYEVRIEAPGEYRVSVQLFTEAISTEPGNVSIGGSMTHNIELRGATLRGRVVDATTGAPVAGARLELVAERPTVRPMISDSDGRFTFELLADGAYKLRARRDRYVGDPIDVAVQGGFAPEVEVRLGRGESVGVRVVDGVDGRVLDAAFAEIVGPQHPASWLGTPSRDESGAQRLWVAAGAHQFRVSVPGYAPRTIDVVVPGPDVQVALSRSGQVVVTGSLAGVEMLRLFTADGRLVGTARPVNPRFSEVEAGTLTLNAYDAAGKVVAKKLGIVVTAGQTVTVDLGVR